MKAVYALYPDPDAAHRAVNSLRAAGVAETRITIVSAEPIERHELGHRDHETWMFWIAAAGGVAGLAVATWLSHLTETSWPLATGNMPIVTWWTNLIIMFELTMLGGILAAVITLLVTARLPNWKPKLYDPEVSDGKILVGVEDPPPGSLAAIERALAASGTLRTI
jgi:hypothetical protein